MLIEVKARTVWEGSVECALCSHTVEVPFEWGADCEHEGFEELRERFEKSAWAFGVTEEGEEIGLCAQCVEQLTKSGGFRELGFVKGEVEAQMLDEEKREYVPVKAEALVYKTLAVRVEQDPRKKTYVVMHPKTGRSLGLEYGRRIDALVVAKHLADRYPSLGGDMEQVVADRELSGEIRQLREAGEVHRHAVEEYRRGNRTYYEVRKWRGLC
jgi:hypothetical protein